MLAALFLVPVIFLLGCNIILQRSSLISTAPAGVDMVYGCVTLGVEGPTAAGDEFCGDSYSPDTLGGVG